MRLDLMALRSSKSGYGGTSIRWFVSTASSYKGSFTRDRRIDEDQSSTQAHDIFYFFKADAWDDDTVSTEQYNEDKRHACVDYGRIHRPHDFIHRLLPATFEGTLRVKERYLRAAGLQQFARRVQGLIEAVDLRSCRVCDEPRANLRTRVDAPLRARRLRRRCVRSRHFFCAARTRHL